MNTHETHCTTLEEAKLKELHEVCRQTGLKLTQQRIEILRELSRAKDHPSAETLFLRVRERIPGVSLDTVYRTLGTFERLQIVDKLNVALDQGRYDANRAPHHHMVCSVCQRIDDFSWEEFDEQELPSPVLLWGDAVSKCVIVSGICKQCLARAEDAGKIPASTDKTADIDQ